MIPSRIELIGIKKDRFFSEDKEVIPIWLKEISVLATDTSFKMSVSPNEITTIGSIPSYSSRDIRGLIKTDQQIYRLMQRAWAAEGVNKTLAVYKYLKVYLHHEREGRKRPLIEDLAKIKLGMDISDILGEKEARVLKHRDVGCGGSWGYFIQIVEKNLEEMKKYTIVKAMSHQSLLKVIAESISENDPEKINELKEKQNQARDIAWKREKERIAKLILIEQKAELNLADFVMY